MQLTPEHKAKMAEGRRRAREARQRGGMLGIKPEMLEREMIEEIKEIQKPPARWLKSSIQSTAFAGLTESECPIDCTPERCVIGGTLHFRNADGTVTKEGVCCHPNKAGLGPIQKSMPEILSRYNRARRHLEHMKIERDLK